MSKCFVTLGRNGDICAVLPVVLDEYRKTKDLPHMMVARDYLPLLEGVTYCTPEPFDGDYSRLNAAVAQANAKFGNATPMQTYSSDGYMIHRNEDSFVKDMWRMGGKLDQFGKLPLVFDRRNRDREEALVRKFDNGKPMILVCTSGISSPFPHVQQLNDLLKPFQHTHQIVNFDDVKATRFFDLLALMERAHIMIGVDSGPLHLAYACRNILPVIALVTHSPTLWHGCPEYPGQVLRIRYNEFSSRPAQETIVNTISNQSPVVRRLIHTYSDYVRNDPGNIRRHVVAKQSWDREYQKGGWLVCTVHDRDLQRNGNHIGESKPVPFLKDIIQSGANMADPQDIIVLTNDDNVFAMDITDQILTEIGKWGAIWGSRQEMIHIPSPPPAFNHTTGYKHVGADLFAFTRNWWDENGKNLPDYLISFESWDLVFRTLINKTGGGEVSGLVAHEIHNSYWHDPRFRECRGNIYNRQLSQQFFARNSMAWPNV